MYKFSNKSQMNLLECDVRLQKLFLRVIKGYDCSVICGYRGKEEQDKAFSEGKSKLQYPFSKHNKQPSLAVDVVPFPIDWNDIQRFKEFGAFVKGVALGLGIEVVWGGDWKMIDMPHWELKC